LINAYKRHDWLIGAVNKRLREEVAKLQGLADRRPAGRREIPHRGAGGGDALTGPHWMRPPDFAYMGPAIPAKSSNQLAEAAVERCHHR
jgi:hypothetical protein